LKFYCETDKVFFCSDCAVISHPHDPLHKAHELPAAWCLLESETQALTKRCTDFEQRAHLVADDLEQQSQRSTQHSTSSEQVIDHTAQSLLKLLDDLKASIEIKQ